MNEIASDMNKSKRQLCSVLGWLTGIAETVWQATGCREMFEIGCHLPTLGKTKTPPADHNTTGQRNGSFRATHSRHGKRLIRVPFYGSMENVCCYPLFSF